MGRVQGKVAVVTGAGSGISAPTARLLVREGARVRAPSCRRMLTEVRWC
jgi:NAD(P)-dependent dehydrogenase (short-subunit alcohol dehydrogenase family)